MSKINTIIPFFGAAKLQNRFDIAVLINAFFKEEKQKNEKFFKKPFSYKNFNNISVESLTILKILLFLQCETNEIN